MKVLFFANKMLSPSIQRKAKLPLQFVCFAHVEAKMYKLRNDCTIVQGLGSNGNSVVYGAIYVLHDDYFHLRTLDAMNNCSKSALGVNHNLDVQHRVVASATPIFFDEIDELARLLYRESDTMPVELYVGNPHHPTIKKRIQRTQKYNHRIKSGIYKRSFLEQYREVQG